MRYAASAEPSRVCGSLALEIAPKCLLSLDGFEQRLEVACAKALRAFALDYLVENCRPVFDRLCEYLKQITFIVAIDENAQLLKRREVFIDFPDASGNAVVIRRRDLEEFHSARLQVAHRLYDVVRRNRYVLHSGTIVELEILIDLRFLLSFGRLVDRKLDAS